MTPVATHGDLDSPVVLPADSRLELMLLAAGILLLLAGPGRVAVDEAWLERRR